MRKKAVQAVSQPRRPRDLLAVGALLAVILLAYSNSLTGGFVFDSRGIILQDPRVRAATAQNLADIFRHTYWWPTGESGLYRPLTTLSYLFNFAVLGHADQPLGYHLVNLLLHFLNSVLWYFVLKRITRSSGVAIAGTLLWCVHPVLTEAVTNIVGRADLLAASALLGGLLIYLHLPETTSWRRVIWLGGLAAVTGIGAFCKESGVMMVGIAGLCELTWWEQRKKHRSLLAWAAVAMLVPIEWFLYRRSIVLATSPPADFPFFDNPITGASLLIGKLTAVKVLAHYLRLILWPVTLSADYSYHQISLAHWSVGDMAAWIVMGGLGIGAAWAFRKNRAIFFLLAFAFLMILPASNLLFPVGTIMAERLDYLPAAAVLGCAVLVVQMVSARLRRQTAIPIALSLLVCALATRTWARNRDWQDDVTLGKATVAASPLSFKAHQMLAEALFLGDPDHRNLDSVLAEARAGIVILDTLPEGRSNPELYRLAGACYLLKGDRAAKDSPNSHPSAESVADYQRAVPVLQHGAAILAALRKDMQEKLIARRESGTVEPPSSNDDLYRLLSVAYLRLGHGDDAFEAAAEGRKHDPLNPAMYDQMADVMEAVGDPQAAASVLMQGMLVTSDMQLRTRLIESYRKGLDGQGCAVVNGPNGPAINPGCDLVRRQLCDVSADAVGLNLSAGRRNTAQSLRDNLVRDYGCPAEPLDKLLKR